MTGGIVFVGSDDGRLYAIGNPSPEIQAATTRGNRASVRVFRANPARTGEMPGPGPDPNQDIAVLWAFPAGDITWSSPVVVDGVVYIGGGDENLYAIDAATGQQRWAFAIGWLSESSPAVVGGLVYIGSYEGNLYAVDSITGELRWLFETAGAIDPLRLLSTAWSMLAAMTTTSTPSTPPQASNAGPSPRRQCQILASRRRWRRLCG